MYLDSLLEELEYECLQGELHIPVTDLVYDTRNEMKQGAIFFCISGAVTDGHKHIDEAIKKGAAALVVEKDVRPDAPVTVIKVLSSRKALAYMSAAFFGHPAKKLVTIGVTGTKGKTTTTYMIKAILENIGKKVGLIGTIETIIGNEKIPNNNTTPESYLIQKYMARMVDAGCDCVVMEASSQGLKYNRIDGFAFDYGIFTNLSPDHIGGAEHPDFEDYLRSKSLLFRKCKTGLINIDDPHAEEILQGHSCAVLTFGFDERADFRATDDELIKGPGFLGISYRVEGLVSMDVRLNIPGKFNIYNSLCAIAICRQLGAENEAILEALGRIKVKGRVELVPVKGNYTVMIDYAHNAMSLESLLKSLREYNPKRLVCLFGCGGNRSRERRFEMGEVSSKLADLTVVTSDNPRWEEPEDIIADILTGVKRGPGRYVQITDRREAVKYCISNAMEGDIIVIAGKGHENYQEIRGIKHHMDDRELVAEALSAIEG